MKVTESTSLFTDALSTMNAALTANRDTMPYSQMITGTEKIAGGRKFGVAVYKDDPDTPHDYYTVKLNDGQIELVDHGKDDVSISWKVSQDYLEKLGSERDKYVENPALMDWDWLKSRVGM